MKKFFIFIISFLFLTPIITFSTVFDELDIQVNPIPKLPEHLQNSTNKSGENYTYQNKEKILLKQGTTLLVQSQSAVSGYSTPNKKIEFLTVKAQNIGNYTLPVNTKIIGIIQDAHPAQLTGNGALIKIKLNEVVYDNISNYTDSKITKANSKKIFFNNIKGKRKYLKNMCGYNNFGIKTCKKSFNVTKKLFNKGKVYTLLSPFPALGGICVLSGNIIISPVLAVFSKGDNLTLPKGTYYSVKILKDTDMYIIP